MAWREFAATENIERPLEEVFEFVADYRNVRRVLEGVSRWEPVGAKERGRDARYRVEIRALAVTVGALLRIAQWDEKRSIAFETLSGAVRLRGGWTFAPVSPGATRVVLRITYQPPAGGVGTVVAAGLEGVFRERLRRALAAMKDELEAVPPT